MDWQKLPLSALLAACHSLNGSNYEKIEHMTLISFNIDPCLVEENLYNKLLWVQSLLLRTNVLFQMSIIYSWYCLKRLARILTCGIVDDTKQPQHWSPSTSCERDSQARIPLCQRGSASLSTTGMWQQHLTPGMHSKEQLRLQGFHISLSKWNCSLPTAEINIHR